MQRSQAEQGRRQGQLRPDQWSPHTERDGTQMDYRRARQGYTDQAFAGYPTTTEGVPYYPPPGYDPHTQEQVPIGWPVAPESHPPMENPHPRRRRPTNGSPSPEDQSGRRRRPTHQAPTVQPAIQYQSGGYHGGRRHHLVQGFVNPPPDRNPLSQYNRDMMDVAIMESVLDHEAAEDARAANTGSSNIASGGPGAVGDGAEGVGLGPITAAGGDDGGCCCTNCGGEALEGLQHCGDCLGNACNSMGSGIGDICSSAVDALCYIPKAICNNCFWPTCDWCSGCTCPDCPDNCCDGCCDNFDLGSAF